jgi:hypothetical protein
MSEEERVVDAAQHVRRWRDGAAIRMLAADFSNGGAERFLPRFAKRDDRPLRLGDRINGRVHLRLVDRKRDPEGASAR